MENRRRIGNDYTFTWPFEVRVDEQTTEPYDLTGRVFRLFMVGQLETFEIPADEIEVDGNEITWTWHGKDQRYPGLYNAKLVENGGEDGMITVDVKYAVTLVPHTWQEGGSDDGCISMESVELVATEVSMTPGPRGPQGEQGPAGPQGETGPAGPQGAPGTAGPQGPEGKSAYEVAVENGFEGTEEEWLESLHGGPRGPQGYSAYEVAVNEGYEGTETEWLASLKGETGATGATGPQGPQGVQGATGPQGPTGATGAQGQQGETGPQGPKGDTGETGATGPQGETGATGPAGERGGKWLEIASTPTAYTTQVGDFLPSYRVSKSAVLTQAGVTDVIVGDILVNSYYVYGVGYVDSDYVYTTARASIRGEKGSTGSAATIAVGTVTTGEAGSQAAVNNRGSSSAAVFDFTIPKGEKGDTGETGAKGPKGDTGETGPQGPTGPAGPSGTLNTNNATAQAVNSSEALSGNVKLHKVSKTGSYNDLLNKPTIPDVSGKEDKSNKVTSLSSSSTDTEYPSAKAVYDALQNAGGGKEWRLIASGTVSQDAVWVIVNQDSNNNPFELSEVIIFAKVRGNSAGYTGWFQFAFQGTGAGNYQSTGTLFSQFAADTTNDTYYTILGHFYKKGNYVFPAECYRSWNNSSMKDSLSPTQIQYIEQNVVNTFSANIEKIYLQGYANGGVGAGTEYWIWGIDA